MASLTPEPSPTAEPSPSSTSEPTSTAEPSADPSATTSPASLEAGTCTVETPCVVQLEGSQFSELHAASFVLVFLALVYVLGWLGRKGRE